MFSSLSLLGLHTTAAGPHDDILAHLFAKEKRERMSTLRSLSLSEGVPAVVAHPPVDPAQQQLHTTSNPADQTLPAGVHSSTSSTLSKWT